VNTLGITSVPAVSESVYAAVRDFLFMEAELLDARRYTDWLGLVEPDVSYRLATGETRDARSEPRELLLYQDNWQEVEMRVKQISNPGLTYAGNPPPHMRRFVSNIQVRPGAVAHELAVSNYLLLWRAGGPRHETNTYSFLRNDTLRVVNGALRLAARSARLDASVVIAPNLPTLI
jgi:PAH dioxygenase small subunit